MCCTNISSTGGWRFKYFVFSTKGTVKFKSSRGQLHSGGWTYKIELEDGRNVSDLLGRLGIPPSKVAIILVDGRHAQQDQPLQDGETVSLFPAIAGG